MSDTQTQTPLTADDILAAPDGYLQFVQGLFNRTGDISKDFTHVVLGILTECDEYLHATDWVHALEEVGDHMFFVTAFRIVLREHMGAEAFIAVTLQATSVLEAQINSAYGRRVKEVLLEQSVFAMDLCKRWVGYGKEPTVPQLTELVGRLLAVSGVVQGSGEHFGQIDFSQAQRVNVEKLLDRYNGTRFNADRAVNRDLAHERETLERASA